MKMLAVALAAAVAALFAVPLSVAVLVSAITGPAAGQELAALACAGSMPGTGAWRPPFQQAYTVSARGFGEQFHPIYRQWRTHTGQDMVSQPGPGPVVAASAGTVVQAGNRGGYGNAVDVQHALAQRCPPQPLVA